MRDEFILSPLAEKTCESNGCPLLGNRFVRKQVPTEVHRGGQNKRGMSVDVMFIAEAPGRVENDVGRPVVGGTGKILRQLVRQLNGGTERGVAYGNIVRCRPVQADDPRKDRPPTPKEVQTCRHNILRDIMKIKPAHIVLLGGSSAVGLAVDKHTGEPIDPNSKVFTLRGKEVVVKTPDGATYPAIITFHFAFISRTPGMGGVFEEDIARAFYRARGVIPNYSARGKPVTMVQTVDRVYKLLKHMVCNLNKDQVVALDYESTTVHRINNKILTIGFAYGPDQAFVIPYRHPESPWNNQEFLQVKDLLRKFFSSREVSFRSLVAHNLKFECALTLDEFGISMWNLPLEDTMLRAHALNENRKGAVQGPFGLKTLSDEWLGFGGYADEDILPILALRKHKERTLAEAAIEPLCEYNGMDCYVTWRLHDMQERVAHQMKYREKLKQLGLHMHGPVSMFAAIMERNGIKANKEHLRFLMAKDSPVVGRLFNIEKELRERDTVKEANKLLLQKVRKTRGMVGIWGNQAKEPWLFHINKPDSQKALFVDVLHLPTQVTKKTQRPKIDKVFYKENKGVCEVDLAGEWKSLDKLRGTYIESPYHMLQNSPEMRDGRIRAAFNFHKTATGRTSSDKPNMQNIPKGKTVNAMAVKRVYTVEERHLMICADYGQAEVRWLAQITGDPKLKAAFEEVARAQKQYMENPTEENLLLMLQKGDFHRQTASQILGKPPEEIGDTERNAAKCVHPQTLVATGTLTKICNVGTFGKPDTFVDALSLPIHAYGPNWTALKAIYNGGIKPLVHVVSKRGILTCSKMHRFQLADGTLKQARKLRKGDVLTEATFPVVTRDAEFMPINVPLGYGLPELQYTPTLETAYFAGLFTGDGAKSGNTAAITHGHINKVDQLGTPYKEWQKIIFETCKELGFTSAKTHPKSVYLGCRHLLKLLEALELMIDKQRSLIIPQWILNAGKSAIMAFLGGFYDTDGSVSKGALSVTTKSPILAGQINTVLRYIGLHPSMEPSWNKTYKKWYYRSRLPVGESGHLKQWMRHPGKRDRLKDSTYIPTRLKKNFIMQVIDAGEGPCLDLSVVSPDHLYMANGFVTHNSIVFGLIYGMSVFGLAERLGISLKEAEVYQEKFLSQFPRARKWLTYIEQFGFERGYVESPLGRRRHLVSGFVVTGENQFFEIDGKRIITDIGKYKSYEDRVCRNAPIQSIASDTNLMACIAIQRYIGEHKRPWRLLNIVHDSIIAEIPRNDVAEYINVVNKIMVDPHLMAPFGLTMSIPFVADFTVGPNWADQIDVDIQEKYLVRCNECKTEREEKSYPENKRCEECGSKSVKLELKSGPLNKVLSYWDWWEQQNIQASVQG